MTTRLSVRSPIAAVSAARLSIFAVPSMNRSWNSFELDPRSLDPSSSGKISPPARRLPPIVVIPEIDAPPCLCRVIPAPTPMFIVLANVVPSNVKLPLSSNSPPVPARTTLPEVKS